MKLRFTLAIFAMAAVYPASADESVKREDLTSLPTSIVALQLSGDHLEAKFRDALVNDLNYCGTTVNFVSPGTAAVIAPDQALLTFEETKKTCTDRYGVCGEILSSEYRITLKSAGIRENVWRANMEFRASSGHYNRKRTGWILRGEAWAELLVKQFQADGLLEKCDVAHLPELK